MIFELAKNFSDALAAMPTEYRNHRSLEGEPRGHRML